MRQSERFRLYPLRQSCRSSPPRPTTSSMSSFHDARHPCVSCCTKSQQDVGAPSPPLCQHIVISKFNLPTSRDTHTNPIDVGICNRFYSPDPRTPDVYSCATLLEVLPQGYEPIPFYVNPSTTYERDNALPLILGGRQCLVFTISYPV